MIGRWIKHAALAATLLAVPACKSPFRTYDDEFGRVADEEALHTAIVLPLTEKAGEAERQSEEPPRERPDIFAEVEQLEVSIEQCRAWTLKNNLDLQVALIAPEIAGTFISEEDARFESLFRATASVADGSPGLAEVFRDQFVRPIDINPGIDVPLRTGGVFGFAIPFSERETFPGIPDTNLYATDMDFTISQPLLRNAGRRANTHFIRIAALDSQIAQARTKLEVIRQIAAADRGYWLLYDASRRLAVRMEQYGRAWKQLDEATARFEGKVGPEIEVVRARAGVWRRLELIYIAELRVKDAQRNLKRILNVPGVDVDSKTRLHLSSEPDPVQYDLDVSELIDASLDQRIELLELELQIAQDMSTIDFAKNQKLPLFTLDYIYRVHGSGPTAGKSAERAFNFEGGGWELALNAQVPLGNDAAEARVHRAILTRLQRLATRSAREQAVKQEVLSALDNLDAAWQRIWASMLTVNAEQRNFEAEQGEYQLGLRNSTDVLIAEDRWAEAKIANVIAVVDYQVAQVDLAFATGMLLGAAKVTW
ncbi:MAG: TolC family protein [Planctomycetota bacterium]|jgi:outer membrane protein TolC